MKHYQQLDLQHHQQQPVNYSFSILQYVSQLYYIIPVTLTVTCTIHTTW